MQEVLDLFGGLQLCVQNRTRVEKGDFPMAYSTEYFKRERLPILQELFSLPENQNKVLGCVVYQGYVNPRTRFAVPRPLDKKALVSLDVFSDFQHEPTKVQVPPDTIPVIEYTFSPVAGDAILNNLHPDFNGQLGGGFPYMEAFWEEPGGQASGPQPPSVNGTRAPQWIQEDGRWTLDFRGGRYINFTNKVMPIGAFCTAIQNLRPPLWTSRSQVGIP